MIAFCNWFTKITGWPLQALILRMKFYYENKSIQGRKIKGPAIIISNHTSVFDYAIMLFTFWNRTLRVQMAEILFKKKVLGRYLKMMGGIYVNREMKNFTFMTKSEEILQKGGVVGIFPEGRLPLKGEERPLEFKPGAAYLALAMNVPIIPIYTNGKYFTKERTRVVVGTPIMPSDIENSEGSDKEKLEALNRICREKIIELGKMTDEKQK